MSQKQYAMIICFFTILLEALGYFMKWRLDLLLLPGLYAWIVVNREKKLIFVVFDILVVLGSFLVMKTVVWGSFYLTMGLAVAYVAVIVGVVEYYRRSRI